MKFGVKIDENVIKIIHWLSENPNKEFTIKSVVKRVYPRLPIFQRQYIEEKLKTVNSKIMDYYQMKFIIKNGQTRVSC